MTNPKAFASSGRHAIGFPDSEEERRLFDVNVDAPGYPREGWTVWLTEEEARGLESRLRLAQSSGAVRDYMLDDLIHNGLGYEAALATVERGDFVDGEGFRPPSPLANPYLFVISYRPTFFGLKSGKNRGFVAWLSNYQRDRIAEMIHADDRVESFQVTDWKPNIEWRGLDTILKERGVG